MSGRVLVTGASRGIGRAVAERLVSAGRPVTAVARDASRLAMLDGANPLVWDLQSPEGLVEEAWRRFGAFGAVVHAAGLAEHRALEGITAPQLERAMGLHVAAPLQLMQAWTALLRQERMGGSAVFLSSTLASRPAPTTAVYAASKAALEAMVRVWAQELAAEGIRVNAVAPGVVDTDMVRVLRLAPGEPMPPEPERARRIEQQLGALASLHPLGRLGTPDEVASTVVHTLDAAWMTGSVVTVDGGLSAG